MKNSNVKWWLGAAMAGLTFFVSVIFGGGLVGAVIAMMIFGVIGFFAGAVIDLAIETRWDKQTKEQIRKVIKLKYPDAKPGDVVVIDGKDYIIK